MDTVVVAAHRGDTLISGLMSGTTLMIVSVVIAAAAAWVMVRHLRNRHQPGA